MSAQIIDLAPALAVLRTGVSRFVAARAARIMSEFVDPGEVPLPNRGGTRWRDRVCCSACKQRGHTRATCTDREALRRADEVRERKRARARAHLESIYSGKPVPYEKLCGICRYPGHDRSTCELRRRP